MSDGLLLWLALLALYLLEGISVLPRGTIVLARTWGGRWRIGHARGAFGSERYGLAVADPLRRAGSALFAHAWPFSAAAEGLLAFSPLSVHPQGRGAAPGWFRSWDDLGEVAVSECRLRVGGDRVGTAASPREARAWAESIAGIRREAPGDREAAIEHELVRSLDLDDVRRRVAELDREARWPGRTGVALLVLLLAVFPASVRAGGWLVVWPYLLAGLAAGIMVAAALMYRAHRRLYPEAVSERRLLVLMTALVPTTAIRAADYLARPALAGCHPLAAAGALLDDAAFASFARLVLLDAHHPRLPAAPDGPPEAVRASERFRRTALARFEDLVRKRGVDPEVLMRPPGPLDSSSRSYCPRCENQFVLVEGTCTDCGGVALVRFQA